MSEQTTKPTTAADLIESILRPVHAKLEELLTLPADEAIEQLREGMRLTDQIIERLRAESTEAVR